MSRPAQLSAAYAFCRQVAKREAKNFYYAFRVLPKAKSDAMCAVYAFMRKADDLADDESKTIPERRQAMQLWLESWRASRMNAAFSDDRIFLALADTQKRFNVSDELLEQLVEGTTMDLSDWLKGTSDVQLAAPAQEPESTAGRVQIYNTFDDLYRYCYLVASVVGLVCIRIFGYKDPRAELLAEKTGVAFQLTNILRDVKEDGERRRIYLPRTLLDEFKVSPEDILALGHGRAMQPNERAMISALSVQAWEYYAAARELLPLIDHDSRAALWVLVEIYSRLLQRIDAQHGDVFSYRVNVPTSQKMVALFRGAVRSLGPGK